MPDPTTQEKPIDKLYNGLVEEKIFKGTKDEFIKKYSNEKNIDQLHSDLSVAGLTGDDKFGFYEKYFPEKRESAAYNRIYKSFKHSGYEGSEDDFKSEFSTPESMAKLHQLAVKGGLTDLDEQGMVQKYFPSKVVKKKESMPSGSYPTFSSLSSNGSNQPTEKTENQPKNKAGLFGAELVDSAPAGKDLGKSELNPDKLEINKQQTEYQKKAAEISKKHGRTAATLWKAGQVAFESGNAVYHEGVNVGADVLSMIGAGAKKLDDAEYNLGISSKQPKHQDEYSTTQASAALRKYANEAFPEDPDLQDNVVVNIAKGLPIMAGAALTRNPTGAMALFGATGFGSEFEQSREAYKQMLENPDQFIADRAQSPEDAAALKDQIAKVRASGKSPEDLAFVPALINGGINTAATLPFLKYFSKLNNLSGGALSKVAANGGSSVIEEMLGARGASALRQGTEQAATMMGITALSNLNAKNSWDVTRKITDGMYQSGTSMGLMGAILGGLVPVHSKRLEQIRTEKESTTDPAKLAELSKEEAIESAVIEHLSDQKRAFDENPELSKVDPKKEEQKDKLAEALENPDISDESRKIISKKLSEIDGPTEDKGELVPILEKNYNQKIKVLESDLENTPEGAKKDIEQKIKDVKEEKKAAIGEVKPEGYKKPKTIDEEIDDIFKEEEPIKEEPKEKPLSRKEAKSLIPVESRIDAEKRHSDDYQLYGEHEQGGLVKIKDIGDMYGFADDQLYYLPKEKVVEPKPEVPEQKVPTEAETLDTEKAQKLKEVGKPEMKHPDLFEAEDVPTLLEMKDYKGKYREGVKARRAILNEHSQLFKIIECLWQ